MTSLETRADPAVQEQEIPADWKPGDVVLGLYEVRDVVGRGGMGTVYRVFHRGWGLDLAVKTPAAAVLVQSGAAELFERECETWMNLGPHPNIVSCHYVRRIGGVPRLFAEYVDGGTLAEWIRKRTLYQGGGVKALRRILDIALQFAWGLAHAHHHELVHQDVKPANVLMTHFGEAKVSDFGLARVLTRGRGVRNAKGTPRYCSPEQSDGARITARTDIWSWAVSILEMFVGEATWMAGPISGDALKGYLEMGAEDPAIPPMPPALAELLGRCLQADPEARPASLEEIADGLRVIYEEAVGVEYSRTPPSPRETSPDWLNNRAASLVDLGKAREAEDLWAQALELQPAHIEASYNRSLTQWRAGSLTDVGFVHVVRDLCGKFPESPLPPYLLAQAYLESGNATEAVAVLKRVKTPTIGGHDIQEALADAQRLEGHSRDEVRTFGSHEGGVSVVCLSGDGCHAVSAGGADHAAGELVLWEVATGNCIHRLKGHSARVTSVCLSADGLFVLSGSADRTLRLWRVANGACQGVFEGHTGAVTSVDLTGDRRLAVSGGEDGTFRLWNTDTCGCLILCKGHRDAITAIDMSDDGSHILSAGADGVIRLWDMKKGERILKLEGHHVPVVAACLSQDRRLAISGGRDGIVKLWDLQEGVCRLTLRGHRDAVTGLCLSPNGRFAVSAGRSHKVRLWDLGTGRCLHTWKGEAPISLSADGRLLLTAGGNSTLKLWVAACDAEPYQAPMMLSAV